MNIILGSGIRDALESSSAFQMSIPTLYWIHALCGIDTIGFGGI